jgi:excisionase family DNA binding protein
MTHDNSPLEMNGPIDPAVGFEELLRARDVARLLGVDPRTVTLWAKQGKLRYHRTVGGHRRYPIDVVVAVLEGRMEDAKRKPQRQDGLLQYAPD